MAEGVPVGITIFARMTIGPSGAGEDEPRRRADGVGLEYFGAGSTLTDEMAATWIEGADAYAC